jgi:hypothetical protein
VLGRGSRDEGHGCSSCRSTKRLEPPRAAQIARRPAIEDSGAREIIDAWLKLAGIYNAVLIAEVLVGLNTRLTEGFIQFLVVACAFLANLCFLMGPAFELLLRRFGVHTRGARWAIFTMGLLVAIVITWECCRFPPQGL